MFYEYAVDPECYADAEQIKRLTGEFGWCDGRLISNRGCPSECGNPYLLWSRHGRTDEVTASDAGLR